MLVGWGGGYGDQTLVGNLCWFGWGRRIKRSNTTGECMLVGLGG